MKKVFSLVVVMILVISYQALSVNAMSVYPAITLDNHIVNSFDYHFSDDDLIVYGNYTQFVNNSEVNEIIKQNDDKIVVFYNINTLGEDDTDIDVYTKNIHIAFINNDGILSEKTANFDVDNFEALKSEMISYFDESISELFNISFNSLATLDEGLFQPIRTGTDRKTQTPYGYIDVSFTVYKYLPPNSVSTLYIVDMHTTFVSGRMSAMNTPGGGVYGEYFHSGSYVHLTAKQAENWDEAYYHGGVPRRGGIPKLKDYWPINTPGTVSISSTYNVSMNLGYSFSNGYSTSNGSSSENGVEVGLSIGYSYSKTYTISEPYMSSQLSSTDNQQAQWTYIYATEWVDASNHARNFILFEMNNNNHSMMVGDFNLNYSLKMTVRKPTYILWWQSGWSYANVEHSRTWTLWN